MVSWGLRAFTIFPNYPATPDLSTDGGIEGLQFSAQRSGNSSERTTNAATIDSSSTFDSCEATAPAGTSFISPEYVVNRRLLGGEGGI
jgi:hypothetical protein